MDTIHYYLLPIIDITLPYVYLHPTTFELVFKQHIDIDLNGKIDDYFKIMKTDDSTDYTVLRPIPSDMILSWSTPIMNKELTHLNVYAAQSTIRNEIITKQCIPIPPDEFKCHIENPNGINIKDFTESVYRLKLFRYDSYNEYVEYIKIKSTDIHSMLIEIMFGYKNE